MSKKFPSTEPEQIGDPPGAFERAVLETICPEYSIIVRILSFALLKFELLLSFVLETNRFEIDDPPIGLIVMRNSHRCHTSTRASLCDK